MAFLGWNRILSYCLSGTSSSFSIWAEMATIRPVMVGISDESGRAIAPLVCRLGSSLRTRTRAPIGSTYSKVLAAVLAIEIIQKDCTVMAWRGVKSIVNDRKCLLLSGYKRATTAARGKRP